MDHLRILLAGHGNIARALLSQFERLGEKPRITIADLREGVDCADIVAQRSKEFDVLVNLTDDSTERLLRLCVAHGLDYIDASLEHTPSDVALDRYFREIQAMPKGIRCMLGCGMNPGLVEHIYFRNRPTGRHLAILLDDDTAARGDSVFGTWSVRCYYDEAIESEAFLSVRNRLYVPVPARTTVSLPVEGTETKFMAISHEEEISIVEKSPQCVGCVFLYHAPDALQNDFQNRSPLSEEEIRSVPVLLDVDSMERVGVLFDDFTHEPYYVFNEADHQSSWNRYRTNGTCWQTACGIYTALSIRPFLERGETVTMSDLSLKYPKEIDAVLDRLGFGIRRIDGFMSGDIVRKRIYPLFRASLPWLPE